MEVNYRFTTLAEAREAIDLTIPLMFDTETIGFYGKIRLAQFYQKGWDKAILVEYPNAMELVSLLSQAIIVGHNIHYDLSTVQYNIGHMAWIPPTFHCTLMLARLHFYKKEGFDLEKVIGYAVGFDPYNGNDQSKSDWSVPVLSEEQKTYAAVDVI